MRIIGLGDIHGYWNKELEEKIKSFKPNIIFCSGDIPILPMQSEFIRKQIKGWDKLSFFEQDSKFNSLSFNVKKKAFGEFYENFEFIIDRLNSFGVPAFLFQGNIPVYAQNSVYGLRNTNLIKEIKKRKNLNYLPLDHKELFNYSFIGVEYHIEKYSGNKISYLYYADDIKSKLFELGKSKNLILLSHQPPYGILDKLDIKYASKLRGKIKIKHGGSKLIKDFVKNFKPRLVLCGHIHENPGVKKYDKTVVVNLGKLKDNGFAVIDINDQIIVNFHK